MSKTIAIGADEIILWMRKNGEAATTDNAVLGRKILILIEGLNGKKVKDGFPSHWGTTADNLGDFGLPTTSAQYTLDMAQLDKLYDKISTW